MAPYEFDSSIQFLENYLKKLPNNGHGVLSKWGKVLGVSTTLLSQILKGKKSLSLELADGLAKEMSLGKKETQFFFLLVEHDRAGTPGLRQHFSDRIKEFQESIRHLKNRIEDTKAITPEIQARYYSSWIYSGLRNLAVCKDIKTLEQIAERFGLPREKIAELIEFLISAQLLTDHKSGWETGTKSTYLPSDSPLVAKHHQNWRLRAMQKMESGKAEDFFYTSPMSLSEDLAREFRTTLVQAVQDLQKKVGPSPSEAIRCLNVDWFDYS